MYTSTMRKITILLSILSCWGCAAVKPTIDFSVYPDRIVSGDTAEIIWKVKNIKEDAKISISGIGSNVDTIGRRKVQPSVDQMYVLSVVVDNYEYKDSAQLIVKPLIIPPPPPPILEKTNSPILITHDTTSNGPDDGRFTIGAGDKRLMYGYPIPYSTSHFIVKVNNKLASNNPYSRQFYGKNVLYMSGQKLVKGSSGSVYIEVKYFFNGISIIQKLIPVDDRFVPIAVNKSGKYYKIEYELTNETDKDVSIGLLLLIDTMIDDNDASQMSVDNTRVYREELFSDSKVPSQIVVYRTYGDTDDLMGLLVTDTADATRPDDLCIGRWPYFHSVAWDIQPKDENYYDSAILLKWRDRTLGSEMKLLLATYYGTNDKNGVSGILDDDISTDQIEIFFSSGSSRINKADRKKIESFIKDKQIKGAIVEGYSDAVGSEAMSRSVAKARANSAIQLLIGNEIAKATIIPKNYGESQADQSIEAQRKGKDEDRKVRITFFVKK